MILKSSVDGRRACSGEDVIYTCWVHNSINLQFSSSLFDTDPIRFTQSDGIGFIASRGPFQATLTNVNMIADFTANFTAQLHVTATMDLNEVLIECSGGGDTAHTTLLLSGKCMLLYHRQSVIELDILVVHFKYQSHGNVGSLPSGCDHKNYSLRHCCGRKQLV